MSVIQYIRDKASWLIISAVVVSLIGFILMDASISQSSLLSGDANLVGKIDGKKITYPEFQASYQIIEKRYSQSSIPIDDGQRIEISNAAWNTIIEKKVMQDIYASLGITLHKHELQSILAGDIVLDIFKSIPLFVNQQTGQINAENIKRYISEANEQAKTDPLAKQSLNQFMQDIRLSALRQKYVSLLKGAENEPKWLQKHRTKMAQLKGVASVVAIPYYAVDIDKGEVNSNDIVSYTKKYEASNKVQEAREIEYVIFDGNPTGQDSTDLLTSIQSIKIPLGKTNNPNELVALTSAKISYTPNFYLFNQQLQSLFPQKAKLIKSAKINEIVGPFIDDLVPNSDNKSYNLVRLMGKKSIPKNVEIRHILIAINANRNEQEAKFAIDSVTLKLRSGEDFATVAATYSEDPGSKDKGGFYAFTYERDFPQLDSTFGKVAFYSPTRTKKVVKTNFGYHYIEVLKQTDFEQAYLLATVTQPIEPSVATETGQFNSANQFSIVSQSEGFQETAKAKQYEVYASPSITPNKKISFPQIPFSLDLVKWSLKQDKANTISSPIKAGNYYIVARTTKIMPAEKYLQNRLKDDLGIYIKRRKVAEQLKSKIDTLQSLEAIADEYKLSVMHGVSAKGNEFIAKDSASKIFQSAELAGTILSSQSSNEIIGPIVGNAYIYVIKKGETTINSETNINQFQQFRILQNKNFIDRVAISSFIETLDKEDNRYKF